MPIPPIIDNRSEDSNLKTVINTLLENSVNAWIASGFFFISGFDLVKNRLQKIKKIDLLIGNETDNVTKAELIEGYEKRKQTDSDSIYLKKEIMKDLNQIKPNNSSGLISLQNLHDYISKGIINVRIYTKTKFHSKAYIFDEIVRDGDIEPKAIVGSSNFTYHGLIKNTELNCYMSDALHVNHLKEWFNAVWNESSDFNADLLRLIKKSAPFNYIQDKNFLIPFELLKKIYFTYLKQEISQYNGILAEFQQIGVENVIDKIEYYNGVIVSDSVGLGKSYIGAEIIRRYLTKQKTILCLFPANIIAQWKSLLKNSFCIETSGKIKFVSHSKFSRMEVGDINKNFSNFDLIIIDEAHRFRNKSSSYKRYENITQLKGKDFLLLTATPLNNSIDDIRNLILIFTNENRLLSFNLNPQAFDLYKKISKKERKGISLEKSDLIDKKNSIEDIGKILDEVMLLRTRMTITQKYPNLVINGQKIKFINPIIHTIEYHLYEKLRCLPFVKDKTDFLEEFISQLYLPHIFSKIDEGNMIGALFKILLLKRLESCIFSFKKSLENLMEKEIQFKSELISSSKTYTKSQKQTVSGIYEYFDKDLDLEYFIDNRKKMNNDIDLEELAFQVDKDTELIRKILTQIDEYLVIDNNPYSFVDPKYNGLKELLVQLNGNKILIFSQFQDTVEYLFNRLSLDHSAKCVDFVTGNCKDKDTKLNRFAPIANECEIKDGYVWEIISNNDTYNVGKKIGPEIDILISTDALSEGVNLQDADIVINYDLPWNPTKIIQRIGRVNRIGNNQQKAVYNFKTDSEIESLLSLMSKLKNKINDIATIVGKEFGILDADENVDIKLIGEKIKKIRSSSTLGELEYSISNEVFQKMEFGINDENIERSKIRNILKKLRLNKENFEIWASSKANYSIIKTKNLPKYCFIYFRIINKKNGQILKNILIKIDDNGESSILYPSEIEISLETPGILLKQLTQPEKKFINKHLEQIRTIFKQNYFKKYSKSFSSVNKNLGKYSKIQQQIIYRLNTLLSQINSGQKQLFGEFDTKSIILLKKTYNRIPFNRADSRILKEKFGNNNPISTNIDTFFKILNNFQKEYIDKNFDYSEEILISKDIKFEEVCWGAFL